MPGMDSFYVRRQIRSCLVGVHIVPASHAVQPASAAPGNLCTPSHAGCSLSDTIGVSIYDETHHSDIIQLQMRHDALHPPLSEAGSQGVWRSGASEAGMAGGRASGAVLRGSIPMTLTSGSTAIDSRGPSTAYGSLGSTYMGSTMFGSPNSVGSVLGGSRSASGVVAVRGSAGAGLEAGALYGIGRAPVPGFEAAQQQQPRQAGAGSGSGGRQQLEADAAAAAQQAEDSEPAIGRMVIAWDELECVQALSKREEGQVRSFFVLAAPNNLAGRNKLILSRGESRRCQCRRGGQQVRLRSSCSPCRVVWL